MCIQDLTGTRGLVKVVYYSLTQVFQKSCSNKRKEKSSKVLADIKKTIKKSLDCTYSFVAMKAMYFAITVHESLIN